MITVRNDALLKLWLILLGLSMGLALADFAILLAD
jgi:hypothetical protein